MSYSRSAHCLLAKYQAVLAHNFWVMVTLHSPNDGQLDGCQQGVRKEHHQKCAFDEVF